MPNLHLTYLRVGTHVGMLSNLNINGQSFRYSTLVNYEFRAILGIVSMKPAS